MDSMNLESISNNLHQKQNNARYNSIVPDNNQKLLHNSRIFLPDLMLDENRKNNYPNLERQFLLAVERSDIASIKRFLDSSQKTGFNINCRDPLGRNAILIAIEYEHIELLELLLKYDLDLGDALLHAINEENFEAVEIIINAQIEVHDQKPSTDYTSNLSSSFTPDITPIILASHRDNYEIIKLLLDRGDRIPKPHDLRCACDICVESQKQDSLRHSKSRINAYQALASPSLIALSSKDPILTAFELSWELKRLGRLENEFKAEYEILSTKCEDFARALLEQTRGSEELAILLNHSNGSFSNRTLNERNADSLIDTHGLARLKLAIKYNQKSFVAHPHCQQLLASLWYEGLPGFRRRPFLYKVGMIFGISAMFPMLATIYLIYPRSTFAGLMKKPFIKFICHSSSYMLFLLLLILAALRIEYNHLENDDYRGNTPTVIEWILIIYIAGFIWQEVKELWENGVKGYIMDMWNLLDFATNSLYVATISLRAVAYYKSSNENIISMGRPKWDSYDPTLISECLFAAANIFSTLKLVYIFTVNPNLGPLQISLGRMLNDIMKFFLIYMLVLVAFACGLNQLLWFYAKKRVETCSDDKNKYFLPTNNYSQNELYNYCATRGKYFTSLFEIVQSLYWSTYGLVDLSNLNLEYPHQFTEFVGKLMFGTYSFITLIVLLNMLIAMMNTSYQLIAEQADIEWKFARSKLWISYFEDGNTLPVPFNIIISPKTIYYLFFWFKMNCLCKSKGKKSRWHSIKKIVSKVNEMEQRYQKVMNNLIMRYLLHRQKAEDNEGVTEDDLNEIKGDISAFRFELLDILKNNGMTVNVSSDRGLRSKLRRKGSKKSMSRLNQRFDTRSSTNTIDQLGSISEISTPMKSKKSLISYTSLEKSKPTTKYKKDRPKKSFSLEDEPSVSFATDLEIFAYESRENSSKLSKVTNKLFSKKFNKKSHTLTSRSVPNIPPNIEKNQKNLSSVDTISRSNIIPSISSQPLRQYNLNNSSPTLNRIYFCQDNLDVSKETRSKRSDLV